MQTADRIQNTQEYYFSKKLREVRALKAAGKPIINLGIGSPDLPPPREAIEALATALSDNGSHQYQPYKGITELRDAMARFYKKNYQVVLDTESEVLPLTGSKEGIMHIAMAFLNKGDQVLIPDPGYPTYQSVTRLLECESVVYHLDERHDWMPNLEELEKLDLSKVKIMWINYPHMPTGAKGRPDMFRSLIEFARKHRIVLVNDNPYSFILNHQPESLLTYATPDDFVLELNSLSKTFNMAGWRVGMLVGNRELIQHVLTVKSNMDSGMFYGLQKGAIAALDKNSDWMSDLNSQYQKRRAWAWKIADALGTSYKKEAAGLFVWARLAAGQDANQITDSLLYDHSVFITPGSIFGEQGQGYIRISLCVAESELEKAYNRISQQ